MKILYMMLVSIVLMNCGAKDSNVTNQNETSFSASSVAEEPMTEEKEEMFSQVGALRVIKLEDGTFQVSKLVLPAQYAECISWEEPKDSMLLVGVVSEAGGLFPRNFMG